jgi:prepilin-type N-terminal cleavage/methylation domain-containing protein
MSRKKLRSGFTLIEVLVGLGLVSIVLVGTAEILIRSIQERRASEDRIRLTEAVCARLERIKGLGAESEELRPGHHEAGTEPLDGRPISMSWDVEETGPGLRRIVCSAAPAGDARRGVRAAVLVSSHIGF